MTVSVVIPAYNEEEFIKNCLISLTNQIVPANEIIVVDNNSTDKTATIVKNFKNIKLIREKKQGITYARNRGFNEATGDIIARCDGDTVLPPDWIKKIKANFANGDIDALTAPVIFREFAIKTDFYARLYFDVIKIIRKGQNTLFGPNFALTQTMWKKIKNKVCLNDKEVHEDVDLGIHISQEGGVIRRDDSLVAEASARRILHNPQSFFLEYPARLINTMKIHK